MALTVAVSDLPLMLWLKDCKAKDALCLDKIILIYVLMSAPFACVGMQMMENALGSRNAAEGLMQHAAIGKDSIALGVGGYFGFIQQPSGHELSGFKAVKAHQAGRIPVHRGDHAITLTDDMQQALLDAAQEKQIGARFAMGVTSLCDSGTCGQDLVNEVRSPAHIMELVFK